MASKHSGGAHIPDDYRPLAGSERRPGKHARFRGPADPDEVFSVTISIRRRPDCSPLPTFDDFAAIPPARRRRMSPDAFAAAYGAAAEDIEKVEEFARSHGLTVVEAHAARRTVVVSGSVAKMSRAFSVELGRYEHEIEIKRGVKPHTEIYRGRNGVVHIPAHLEGIILGVFGLDNRTITRANAADPPNTTPLSVPVVAGLYDYPQNSAAGQTIGIFSLSGYAIGDINAYFASLAGFATPTVTDILVHGTNSGVDPFGETTQDIEISASFAPGANVAVFITNGSQAGWVDAITRFAHPNAGDPQCSVLSSSWYICNGDDAATLSASGVSTALVNAVSAAFHDAAIQGLTVCIACGDTGTDSKVGDGKAHVQYPGSDPWVLSVGGTTIGNVNGASFDEYVWNDPAPSDPTHWGTTGGGVSDFFGVPSYQSGVHIPVSVNGGNHVGRGVPDVAGNASANSGYSGLVLGGGGFVGNGTSASAPQWAGLIAVINAALGGNVGFVNPAFYALGSAAFRDITPGAGPVDNRNGGVAGYPAHIGWDACTGWGSPDGMRLLAGLMPAAILVTAIPDSGDFGTVCLDAYKDLPLTIDNSGFSELLISAITSSSPDFLAPGVQSYPIAVAPGDSIEVAIRFKPVNHGLHNGIITIQSNSLAGTQFVNVRGTSRAPRLVVSIADQGNFGDACVGRFRDEPLVLANAGPCVLTVSNITSSQADFLIPSVHSFPLTIGPGDAVSMPIRFQPATLGNKAATLTIFSDDPASPTSVRVHGVAPAPRLVTAIADSGHFGHACVGSFVDEPLVLNNSGHCGLSITSIISSSNQFLVPSVLAYPISIGPGDALPLPIRFAPTSFGTHGAVLEIFSDDPAGPHIVEVTGEAPPGRLAVTGSTYFGGVPACCREERTIAICNVGDCKLHVTRVAFRRHHRHFKLINNPFPATLHPGSCLNVVIRYKATEKCPRACELVIHSDDPAMPVRELEVLAYTIWEERCGKCCDDCRKGCCKASHHADCCRKCCDDCDDDDEGHEHERREERIVDDD